MLVLVASVIAVPIGILIGIHASEFARPRISYAVRFALDILAGVPTIITGIFIFGLLVVGHQQSGYDGSIALAIVMLPIVARSAQEVLGLVPNSLREAAQALGIARWRMVARIVVPRSCPTACPGTRHRRWPRSRSRSSPCPSPIHRRTTPEPGERRSS